jgi:hypothetical protein
LVKRNVVGIYTFVFARSSSVQRRCVEAAQRRSSLVVVMVVVVVGVGLDAAAAAAAC